MPRAALFDMDKTLIRVNSARLFAKFRRDRGEVGFDSTLRVSWWLLRYWIGNLDAHRVAKIVLGDYRGTEESHMVSLCNEWFHDYVKPFVTERARQAVEHHKSQGDVLIIASSSTRYATGPLCEELGMHHVICSELEVKDGMFTGEVLAPLCYGPGKLTRVSGFLQENGLSLSDATFYSDSITDVPLLEAVGTAVVVNPDPRLSRLARRRGWRQEMWLD